MRPKILVVDNETNIQKLVKVNLAASGYDVLAAGDGETGLRLAQRERPSLVLLDLRMPGMSGWDVLKALKADPQLKGIPVVLMTASVQHSQEERALQAGAAAYLTKPFTIDDLVNTVKKSLGE